MESGIGSGSRRILKCFFMFGFLDGVLEKEAEVI